jgi:asparagine synthase (glutamine-hydrolysing)
MCGLAGVLASRSATDLSDATLRSMGAALQHRGPDGGASWSDAAAGVGLVHRRLAIIDLSDAGLQPMHSHSGRFVLAYNGEIYNHRDVRQRIEAEGKLTRPWTGTSDTETLLAAIEAWGVAAALAEVVGMFALALWDREGRRLWLARDRMGEKPLYYGVQSGVLLFGSELKAITAHPAFRGEIDPVATEAMLRLGYIPAPLSIYKNISKLPAGGLLAIDVPDGRLPNPLPEPQRYWTPSASFAEERARGLLPDAQSTVIELERLLTASVGDQMMADVPLGAFLSGGIDSTLVTALMQARSSRPVRTFTIGFTEAEFNEADAAKAVARHLGTDHTEFYVTAQDSLDVIPQLPSIYDEPFADASQIPTHIICRMARQHVTVALSGDGGDELFGGYNRHVVASQYAQRLMRLPNAVRRALAATLLALPRARMAALAASVQTRSGGGLDLRQVARKLNKVAAVLEASNSAELHRAFVEHATPFGPLALTAPYFETDDAAAEIDTGGDLAQEIMLRDMLGYLPDDVLVKVDRAAMSNSLETRAPFLDHRVVAFSHRLPASLKVHNGRGKQVLRQILDRHVPRALVERPKMGFTVPIDMWLRGPLREWAETLLSEESLKDANLLNVSAIRRMWSEHATGKRNWQVQIWSVLMLQAWLAEQRGNKAVDITAIRGMRVIHA